MMKKLLFLLLISVYLLGSFEISKAISGADTGQDCRIKPGGGKTCDACVASYCAKDWYDKPFCYEVMACIGEKYGGSSTLCYNAPYLDNGGNCFFDSEQCNRWKSYLSKTYGSCDSDLDCFEGCPSDKPDWPHMQCDNKNKKCMVVKSCGKNECKEYSDCCASNEKYPHYKCYTVDYMGGKVWQCGLDYSCGVDECDPKNTKYSAALGINYNPDCRSYECKKTSSSAQCVIDNRGKYANRLFCEKDCQVQSTTTTTVITTTTTKASPGTTLPVVTTTKASVGPGDGGASTTTTTKKIPTTTTTTLLPFCTINALEFVKYTQGGFRSNFYTKVFALLNIPKDKILTNPKFEYAASNCEECFLDIINLDNGKKVTQFYIDNKTFGKLDDDGLINPSIKNRYLFERGTFYQNGLDLNVSSLYPGRYEIILKCVDPSDRDYKIEQSLRLNVFPSIRWRESLPAID